MVLDTTVQKSMIYDNFAMAIYGNVCCPYRWIAFIHFWFNLMVIFHYYLKPCPCSSVSISIIVLQHYTVLARYSKVHYNTALHSLKGNYKRKSAGILWTSKGDPLLSPSPADQGLSIVNISERSHRVIARSHCFPLPGATPSIVPISSFQLITWS